MQTEKLTLLENLAAATLAVLLIIAALIAEACERWVDRLEARRSAREERSRARMERDELLADIAVYLGESRERA